MVISILEGEQSMKTILIVEDDESMMAWVNDVLQGNGYKTLQSVDGMDVMQLAREHSPDLIIMDIRLPVVSGIEHTIMLKADEDLKDIPVIAFSGAISQFDIETFDKNGFIGFIPKPVHTSTFLDMIEFHIE